MTVRCSIFLYLRLYFLPYIEMDLLDFCDTLEEYQKSIEVPAPDTSLQVSIARIVATKFRDLPAANTIFSKIKHDYKSYIAWASLGAYLQDFTKVRSIYSMAVKKPMKDSEFVYQHWIDFEMIHGSCKDMEKCMATVLLSREKDIQHHERQKAGTNGDFPHVDKVDAIVGVQPGQFTDDATVEVQPKKRAREPSAASEGEMDAKKQKKEENRKIGDFSTYKVISQ